MNLVEISVYGQGYYSNSEYNENIFLLEEDYNSFGEELDSIEISLGELDGKHSDVSGEIDITLIPEDLHQRYIFENLRDGTYLRDNLKEYTDKLCEMENRAKEYIASLDTLTSISFKVRKSQVEEVRKIVAEYLKEE